jgi:hypothetical protein
MAHDPEPDETDLHDPSSLRAVSPAEECYNFGRRLKPRKERTIGDGGQRRPL